MSNRIYVIDGGKTFYGTLEQFAATFAAYGTITDEHQIIALCVEWQCNLYWKVPASQQVNDIYTPYVPPRSLQPVGVLEGQVVCMNTKLYDQSSGLEVVVINSEQAVHINDAGNICYIAHRKNGCWTFTAPSTWEDDEGDPDETNTEALHIVGYANKTALHPLGSYIRFEPGQTVFATPVVYLSEAQEKIDALKDRIAELEQQVESLTTGFSQ
jgi:hypothetical protein